MQRIARLAFAAVVFATGPLVAACDSLETFELFDTKKKLQGERKPVFPEGVPGTASGIPAELVKGYREPEHGDVTDPAKVAAEAAAVSNAKPKFKPPAPPKPPATAKATPPAPQPQRTAAKPPTPPAQSSAANSAAAPPASSSPPAPIAATPLPWPGTPASGTVVR